jgi:hypothetical protein
MRGWAIRLGAVILGRRVTRMQDKNWVGTARRRAEGEVLMLCCRRLRFGALGRAILVVLSSGSMLGASSVSGTGGLTPPSGPPGTQTGSYSITVSAVSDATALYPPRRRSDHAGSKI